MVGVPGVKNRGSISGKGGGRQNGAHLFRYSQYPKFN